MLPLEEALARVAEAAGDSRCRVERVALDDALGRVLAEDVRMDHDVPPFDRAAMDGFAVAEGVLAGTTLTLAGRVPAGVWPTRAVGPGEAIRINTGAPVPEGTARVIPVEWTTAAGDGADTDTDADTVTVDRLASTAAHVVPRGDHVSEGDVVVSRGRRLEPGAISALATAGIEQVPVAVGPSVAVLGTGSELVPVGTKPGPGQIRNSNTALLRAQTRRAGGVPVDLGVAPDEELGLRAAIRAGLEADLLVLSGGVSRGDLDLVPGALEAEGAEKTFHRWGVQPGGPLWFGTRGDTLVFGLPGNPAASFVGFELLVVPAIETRLGRPFAARRTLHARFRGPWGKPMPRRRFRPVTLSTDPDGTLVAEALPWRGSGDPFAGTRAEGLAALPEGVDAPGGDEVLVEVLPLEPLR